MQTIKMAFVPRHGVFPVRFPVVCCREAGVYFLGCPDCVRLLEQTTGSCELADRLAVPLEIAPGYGAFEMNFVLRCLGCGHEWETRPGSVFQLTTVLPIWDANNERNGAAGVGVFVG